MASSSSSNIRSPSSLPNLLLTSLNFTLFLLSSASLVPILVIRTPPTSFGTAIITTILLTIISSSFGFYTHHSCCWSMFHVITIATSMICLAFWFFAMFLKEEMTLEALVPVRRKKETKMLFRMEEFAILGMFVLQSVVLMMACILQSWWGWEYKGFEVEKGEVMTMMMTRKRDRRMVRVQEECSVIAAPADKKVVKKEEPN